MQRIVALKRNILAFKRSITPQRDVIGELAHADSKFISKRASRYYMDVYDNLMWVYTSLDSNRDLLNSAFDAFSSTILNKEIETSNRLNKIMQRLTVVSTIFLPLTFIASVYGMNFKNMPELGWEYGYFIVLLILLAIAVVMIIYFKRKGWFEVKSP